MKIALNTRQILLVIVISGALAATAAAQGTMGSPPGGTTGSPGLNDYTVNGFTPGSRSCQFIVTPAAPTPIVLNIDTVAGLPVMIVINLGCPCKECHIPFAATGCVLPLLDCGLSNHAFELWPPCSTIVLIAVADAFGNATINATVPTSIFFSTQAAVLGPPCDLGNPVLTQAYNVYVPPF